jgi:phosphoribosyl 1,2-cyclic phosphate phosphodiesterase
MKLTFLGTGTSYGVPFVGCDCAVCRSDDPRNKRLRCSILVEDQAAHDGPLTRLLVDTTPDLRQQLLRANVREISAILWTHLHNDHVIGLDDIRPITDRCGYLHGYANSETIVHLKRVFDYVFVQGREHGGFPRITDQVLQARRGFNIGSIAVTPIAIWHGKREIFAYRFECDGKVLVYSTDCSAIPDESWDLFGGADVLVLDALRHKEHPTHFSLGQALAVVEKVKPRRAFFTHFAHDLDHAITDAQLPAHVNMAYDTLTVEI